jgi:DNA-binding transcriptional ArsR family regulator
MQRPMHPQTTRNASGGDRHAPGGEPGFDETAVLLKALGHPLRLRLVCGLVREPSSLSRIASNLGAPISSVALHLGVLRRAGILTGERNGAEILFHVGDARARMILGALCAPGSGPAPAKWAWGRLAQELANSR